MQERDMLEIIRALAAEERRLRAQGLSPDDPRLGQVTQDLNDTWAQLRAARDGGAARPHWPEDSTQDPDTLAS